VEASREIVGHFIFEGTRQAGRALQASSVTLSELGIGAFLPADAATRE
jgi:hypothetical protein